MAVLGIGIDIIGIERIKHAAERNTRFLERVFTANEINYFNSRNNNPCHIAGTFAAKEAVLKALGTGLSGIGWKDIEILREDTGKPVVRLHGNGWAIGIKLGVEKIHVSISHEREYAVSQVVLEGRENYESCNS